MCGTDFGAGPPELLRLLKLLLVIASSEEHYYFDFDRFLVSCLQSSIPFHLLRDCSLCVLSASVELDQQAFSHSSREARLWSLWQGRWQSVRVLRRRSSFLFGNQFHIVRRGSITSRGSLRPPAAHRDDYRTSTIMLVECFLPGCPHGAAIAQRESRSDTAFT